MRNNKPKGDAKILTDHYFRTEYGRMTSVISKYVGIDAAEDIVQETLLVATENWQHKGIPANPQAWLYKTAKNIALNVIKRKRYQTQYEAHLKNIEELKHANFTEEIISDEQLKMMFVCCHPSISENTQIALILKILCGFSITEIANSCFSTRETINKRLVRGRQQLKKNKISTEISDDINERLGIILKTIYLLFNEGYFPSKKHEIIRYDLCIEAIRLVKVLISNHTIKQKADCHALLALMYLNASRFEARISNNDSIIEMEKQNRKKWNQELIQSGIHHLDIATKEEKNSIYLILAAISANHCVAVNFKETNWGEILLLYDKLLKIENSPIIKLNRSIALANAKGNMVAIAELKKLESDSDIGGHYLFHSTLGELYKKENQREKAVFQFEKAITLAKNERDINLLKKKISDFVPY